MSIPIIGRNAICQMNGTTVGFATNFSDNINAALIKEYAIQSGGDKPAILASGNKDFKISCSMLYVGDILFATQILNGTPVDFILAPAGTSSGKTKITIKNVVLTVSERKYDQKGVIMQNISGEGNDYQLSTW